MLALIIFFGLATLLAATIYSDLFSWVGRQGCVTRGPGRDVSSVAFTFDDGPDPNWTPQVLQVLKESGAQATFFLIGEKAKGHPELVRQIAADGHEIGNHTLTHSFFWWRSTLGYQHEILETNRILKSITGRSPSLFRPPRGLLGKNHKRFLAQAKLDPIFWSVNPKDWAVFRKRSLAERILKSIHRGAIILMHDSGNLVGTRGGNRLGTIEALYEVLPLLKKQGWKFVTVSKLLRSDETA
jgi:peptidoglycan-N-acetylglucosamine deacetylase